MKNILLLTDFSKNSTNAIRYALQLFKHRVCNFYVLHVQDSATYTTDDLILAGNNSIYDSIVKTSKNKLAKLVVELESEFRSENFNYQIIVDFDALIASIVQVQKLKQIDLIVMGTNGATGAKEVIFGSNTINVIRKVNCPTLVIPEGFKYRTPNNVLLPLDIFDSLGGNPFVQLLKFITNFSKTLHLLRVKQKNKPSKAEKKDKKHIDYFLKEITYQYHIIIGVPMQYVVSCYSQSHTIDLITLLVQKESLFERFFIGSTTTQISNKINTPLLIFHS